MKKILVVDDESPIAEMIADFCQTLGFETKVLVSGENVMETAKSYRPDLITLDLIMPEVSGLEVLEMLRMDDQTKRIPVLVISSIAHSESLGTILHGSAAVMQKPVQLASLKKKVKDILSPA